MKNKQHMKAEMAALKRGGASKKVMSEERAEYKAEGYANGGMVGAVNTSQPHVGSASQNAMKRAVGGGGMPGGCFYQVTSKVDYGK